MSSTQNGTHTHCTVRWENTTDYAVVHLERAKTAVTTLKVGIVITFEGYQRARRRGEILFLGNIGFYLRVLKFITHKFRIELMHVGMLRSYLTQSYTEIMIDFFKINRKSLFSFRVKEGLYFIWFRFGGL